VTLTDKAADAAEFDTAALAAKFTGVDCRRYMPLSHPSATS
jgi:hypothetical protein